MLTLKKLKRPNKRSGFKLPPGETTEIRGVTIVNRNSFAIYVDKFTPKKKKKR